MVWKVKRHLSDLLLCMMLFTLSACSIKYHFTGTSINYDVIKSIQIDKIPNRAPYGWAPMESMFNNKLQDIYANQTRLRLVKRGGDLHISGEITAYDQYNKAVELMSRRIDSGEVPNESNPDNAYKYVKKEP